MRGAAQLEIVRRLADAATIEDASHGVLATLAGEFGWDVALLWLPEEGALRCGTSWTRPGLEAFERVCGRLSFGPGVGLPGRVWASGAPEWVPDVAGPAAYARTDQARQAGLTSAVGVPVGVGDETLGVIELLSCARQERDAEQEQLLAGIARQLGHFVDRAQVQERLRTAEERTAAIVDAALDAVITMDHEGCVLSVNRAAEEIFGYRQDEAMGRPLAELVVPSHLRDAHRAGLQRYVETGESTILGRRLELMAMRAGGEVFPVELTITRVGTRQPPVFAGFVRDITLRREAEEERRRLVQEAMTARASEEAARKRAEHARARAEDERRRMEFLAAAGLRMAASLDYSTALEAVARAAVPHLADLCAVTVVEAEGGLRPVAVVHADPALEHAAREIVHRHPPAETASAGIGAVLRGGQPELVPDVTEEHLRAIARDAGMLEGLRRLALRSGLTVPIRASGRTLGAIALYFGDSGRRFSEDDLTVATALAARAGLHIENARLYTERSRVAHELQQSFLPAELPTIAGLEVAARYRAASEHVEVGGDFYDVFPAGDGAWAAIIGDVSGKGAPAASLTALARHTLYATSLLEPSPAANLALLNEAMRRRGRDRLAFCTVVYARLRPAADGTHVTLASGGHPPPLVLRADGSVEYVEASGTLIGALEEAPAGNRELTLAPGELMLLYTDGATELRRDDLFFGERALEAALRELAGRPAEEVLSALARRIEALQVGSARDDVALLALRVPPRG